MRFRSHILLFLLCCSGILSAQDFLSFRHQLRVELSCDILSLKQTGQIYTNLNHDPVLYYQPTEIDHSMSSFGFGLRAWYAFNFATPSFEKIGIGLETGIHIASGRADLSVVPPADPKAKNLRFPVLISIRHGACVDRRYYGKLGYALAAGVEILRSSIPNETGMFLLPKVEGMMNVKKVNFFVGIYPIGIKSYYLINGERVLRQKTGMYDIGVRFGITQYAKKYRGNKKLNILE